MSSRVILTGSQLLARTLRVRYSQQRLAAGEQAWDVPAIYAIDEWIRRAWESGWPKQQLLHAVQEQALFADIIATRIEPRYTQDLISSDALARELSGAMSVALLYGIDVDAMPALTDDQALFKRCWRAAHEQLAANNWLLSAQLPNELSELVAAGQIALPAQLVLQDCPDPLPAAQGRLVDALRAAGVELLRSGDADVDAYGNDDGNDDGDSASADQFLASDSTRAAVAANCLTFNDPDHQSAWLVADITARLAALPDDVAPPDIVVASGDPEALEKRLRPLLLEAMLPRYFLNNEEHRLPWRCEKAPRLSETPLLSIALDIVALQRRGNDITRMSRVLLPGGLHPHAGQTSGQTSGQNELARDEFSEAECALRARGGALFDLADCAGYVRKRQPLVAAWFENLDAVLVAEPRKVLPSAWVEYWRDLLIAAGWPGDLLGSQMFQARQEWDAAMARLAAMDQQLDSITATTARGWLRRIVEARRFQPRVDHLQPIRIVDFDSVPGLDADVIYALDMDTRSLPFSRQRVPLIAGPTLAAADVPRVTPESCVALSEAWLKRVARSASELYFCVPLTDENAAQRVPTMLLENWTQADPVTLRTPLEVAASKPRVCETVADDPVPPVADKERAKITGGASIFRNFAVAPFAAFARNRLHVESYPERPVGLDALRQGILIHAVLEDIWAELADSQGLKQMLADDAHTRVRPFVEAAADRQQLWAARYGAQLVEIEQLRVVDIVVQWLRHEQRRREPFRVLHRELEATTQVAGLPVRLKLDRVDEVQDEEGQSRLLVIDYKTGKADAKAWRNLKEPQLPLYAAFAAGGDALPRCDGICFGRVADGHPALAINSNWCDFLIDGGTTNSSKHGGWDGQLSDWTAALEQSATDFLNAVAWIDPNAEWGGRYGEPDLLPLLRFADVVA